MNPSLPDLARLRTAFGEAQNSRARVEAAVVLATALAPMAAAECIALCEGMEPVAEQLGMTDAWWDLRLRRASALLSSSQSELAGELVRQLERDARSAAQHMAVAFVKAVRCQRGGDLGEALGLALDALDTPFAKVGADARVRANLHGVVGNVLAMLADAPAALRHYREMDRILRLHGPRELLAIVSYNLGRTLWAERQCEAALAAFDEGLAQLPTAAVSYVRGALLCGRGAALVDAGRPRQAIAPVLQSVNHFEALDHQRGLAAAFFTLALAHRATGAFDEAERHFLDAMRIQQEAREWLDLGETRVRYAQLLAEVGRNAEALDLVQRTLQGPHRSQMAGVRLECWELRVKVFAATGAHESAAEAAAALAAEREEVTRDREGSRALAAQWSARTTATLPDVPPAEG